LPESPKDMNMKKTFSEELYAIDEPYLAGLYQDETKGYFYRHCAAYAAWFRATHPYEYQPGDLVYPRGNAFLKAYHGKAATPQYANTWQLDAGLLKSKSPEAAEKVASFAEVSYRRHGWLHGTPHYSRIIREGLNSYRERILARPEGEEFREGLLLVIDAIKDLTERCVVYLKSVGADSKLIAALERVPFFPAESYYEGLIAWNMIFFLDGCDNLGCLDAGLAHLFRGEDLTDVIAQMFDNVDQIHYWAWSCTVGPDYNEITRQAIRAVKGNCKPMLEVMVKGEVPSDIWRLAAENYATHTPHPSFYNAPAIRDMLHDRLPQIEEKDLRTFCGCGCTETNLEGITRAGGTDADLNLLLIFEQVLHTKLEQCPDFADFYEELCRETEKKTHEMLDAIIARYRHEAKYLPNPTRTLFVDDCIDKGLDYNAGGARYTWTMNSNSGLINVIDSLAAVRKLVYEEKRYTPQEFLTLLDREDEDFYRVLKECPVFGTDDRSVDELGRAYVTRVYMPYREHPKADFIDAYFLTEHQFNRYEWAGTTVGPTPDGRHAHEATCDSVAALRGKAIKGPTAMLNSAARLPQNLAEGISVLNLTLSEKLASDPEVIQSLVEGYFRQGGIQIQITVTSPEELQDAMLHPEKHEDLVVRVGGYSEYFNRLSPTLKKAVLERNIHGM